MNIVKSLPEFDDWLAGVPDKSVRGAVLARVRRLEFGLFGDVAPVGDGVLELRIHLGAGWRVYFVQHGKEIIVLLAAALSVLRRAISNAPKYWQNCCNKSRGFW
jgi:putative addiction module killer protein